MLIQCYKDKCTIVERLHVIILFYLFVISLNPKPHAILNYQTLAVN